MKRISRVRPLNLTHLTLTLARSTCGAVTTRSSCICPIALTRLFRCLSMLVCDKATFRSPWKACGGGARNPLQIRIEKSLSEFDLLRESLSERACYLRMKCNVALYSTIILEQFTAPAHGSWKKLPISCHRCST